MKRIIPLALVIALAITTSCNDSVTRNSLLNISASPSPTPAPSLIPFEHDASFQARIGCLQQGGSLAACDAQYPIAGFTGPDSSPLGIPKPVGQADTPLNAQGCCSFHKGIVTGAGRCLAGKIQCNDGQPETTPGCDC